MSLYIAEQLSTGRVECMFMHDDGRLEAYLMHGDEWIVFDRSKLRYGWVFKRVEVL
jgi:hypothetical protein